MTKTRKTTIKTDTGQSTKKNVKSVLHNPYPNQVLTKLVGNQKNMIGLSESESIQQSTEEHNQ